mmetsp:Transcript_1486/g.3418  ORF Transcript_1486/g.3418 Transcript_1486/m.3418 type:complete len:367 (+) Transcript_1486:208-1308(+)
MQGVSKDGGAQQLVRGALRGLCNDQRRGQGGAGRGDVASGRRRLRAAHLLLRRRLQADAEHHVHHLQGLAGGPPLLLRPRQRCGVGDEARREAQEEARPAGHRALIPHAPPHPSSYHPSFSPFLSVSVRPPSRSPSASRPPAPPAHGASGDDIVVVVVRVGLVEEEVLVPLSEQQVQPVRLGPRLLLEVLGLHELVLRLPHQLPDGILALAALLLLLLHRLDFLLHVERVRLHLDPQPVGLEAGLLGVGDVLLVRALHLLKLLLQVRKVLLPRLRLLLGPVERQVELLLARTPRRHLRLELAARLLAAVELPLQVHHLRRRLLLQRVDLPHRLHRRVPVLLQQLLRPLQLLLADLDLGLNFCNLAL